MNQRKRPRRRKAEWQDRVSGKLCYYFDGIIRLGQRRRFPGSARGGGAGGCPGPPAGILPAPRAPRGRARRVGGRRESIDGALTHADNKFTPVAGIKSTGPTTKSCAIDLPRWHRLQKEGRRGCPQFLMVSMFSLCQVC